MSFDRYQAIKSIRITGKGNTQVTKYVCIILWLVILVSNIPQLFLHSQHEYTNFLNKENRTVCILNYGAIVMDATKTEEVRDNSLFKIKIFYLVFFLFAYVLPFASILIIYGMIMKILIHAKGQGISKKKTRITFMVIAVVASFVICWTPLQIMLFLQHVVKIEFTEVHATLLILSNCIAYLNACVNPIIYGFANESFRK